jgi:broad specificity phosphatase PhoE
MKTRLTLLRHGQSQANADGILQGQSDWPLSELGRQQSDDLAAHWASTGVTFTSIISSPLTRALDTATAIASQLDSPVEEDPQLMERKWGRFEGQSLTQIQRYFQDHPPLTLFDHVPPDGESFWQLYARAGSSLQGLLRREPASYLVVSHGGLLAAMHMIALQIAPALRPLSGPKITLDNCGFSTLEYDHDRPRWTLHQVNASVNSPSAE